MNLTPYPPLKALCKSHAISRHGDIRTANHLLNSNIHTHNQRTAWMKLPYFRASNRHIQLNSPPIFLAILAETGSWNASDIYFHAVCQRLCLCSSIDQRISYSFLSCSFSWFLSAQPSMVYFELFKPCLSLNAWLFLFHSIQ